MPEEFTPEASVDFEALAAAAAGAANGNVPRYAPPPEPPAQPPPSPRPRAAPALAPTVGDPFQTLAKIAGDQELVFHEFGALNARMRILQLETALAFGAALLLAVMAWKFANATK